MFSSTTTAAFLGISQTITSVIPLLVLAYGLFLALNAEGLDNGKRNKICVILLTLFIVEILIRAVTLATPLIYARMGLDSTTYVWILSAIHFFGTIVIWGLLGWLFHLLWHHKSAK